jgi:hypothetical protein
LHDRIIALRGKIWTDETSLTPPFIIEVPVPSQESQPQILFLLIVPST